MYESDANREFNFKLTHILWNINKARTVVLYMYIHIPNYIKSFQLKNLCAKNMCDCCEIHFLGSLCLNVHLLIKKT